MYEDKTLTCRECGAEFLFSASEQQFYAEKGFENEPGRCPDCRAARKARNRDQGFRAPRGEREMFDAVCASCGVTTQVPFQPKQGRPVYCRDCYQGR